MDSEEPPDIQYNGSFGIVTVYKKTQTVVKKQCIFDKDGHLDFTSLSEGAISNFISSMNCKNLPLVDKIEVSQRVNQMTMHMPYYGQTLNVWLASTPRKDRVRMLPLITYQIVNACEVLFHHNIQHTDIKPANILINGSQVTLIDFNTYSVKGIDGWVPSVGTWCYVAPEILYHGTPHDKSMVWSIGLIIAEICAGYALGTIEKVNNNVNSRTRWMRIMEDFEDSFGGMPLTPQHYNVMTPSIRTLFEMCTTWDPSKRASYSQLATYIENKFTHTPSTVHTIVDKTITLTPKQKQKQKQRSDDIDIIARFCNSKKGYSQIMYRSIWLYDNDARNEFTVEDIVVIITTAYTVMGYTLDEVYLAHVHSHFLIPLLTLKELDDALIKYCVDVKWDVYAKGGDMFALEAGASSKDITSHLPDVMKAMTTSYNGYSVCKDLLKAISASVGNADASRNKSVIDIHSPTHPSVETRASDVN